MLTYHESTWAARRWDWFNGGRIVKPLSFCQFWRTVIFYATVKWLLVAATFPVRPAFHCSVAVGERIEAFNKRHGKGVTWLGRGLIALVIVSYASFVLTALAVAHGLWVLVGIAGGMAGALASYGIYKAGVLGLLWQAAVAAHHGICPPMEIERD